MKQNKKISGVRLHLRLHGMRYSYGGIRYADKTRGKEGDIRSISLENKKRLKKQEKTVRELLLPKKQKVVNHNLVITKKACPKS